jgi:CO/xanthine dehydrogenase FAD-binding subunit
VYARPTDLAEALRLAAEPDTRVLAGGTDLFPAAGERPLRGRHVDVTALEALHGIAVRDDWIRIGAAVTWSEIARARLPPAFNALRAAAREVGGVQIQNRGTIAGNLCNASPAADGVPPLLILDAEVELASTRGGRRVPLGEFVCGNRRTTLLPGEIMTAVIVPRPAATAQSSFLKLGARRYLVISIVMIAVMLDIRHGRVHDARVAAGACSAAAGRLKEVERRVIGAPADSGLGSLVKSEHLSSLSPIDDLRATAEYRRDAALTLVRRALECCLDAEAGGII